jgi:nucleoside-diphosphate-sugar epimerase
MEFETLGAKYIICDARNTEDMRNKLSGQYFDVVANFLMSDVESLKNDVEIFHGNVGQYFFTSSWTVYQKPGLNIPITEDTPLKNPYSPYARNKIACEMYLLDRYREIDFPVVIVRPSHTYGEEKLVVTPLMGWSVPHWTLADRILNKKPIIVHGTGRSLWTVTHSDDYAYAFCGLMGDMRTIGHQFHITNDEVMTLDTVMETYGLVLGVKPEIVHIPVDFIAKMYHGLGDRIIGDMAENGSFDNSKIRRFVPGFWTRVPLRDGLARSIKWYMDHPDQKIISDENNALTDKLIATWNDVTSNIAQEDIPYRA